MRAVADVIIPISPKHQDKAQEAIASAEAQTLPVHVIPLIDSEQRGAAWTRNEAVKHGSAEFLIFLDADDVLLPDFASHTLAKWLEKKSGYIYTDWWRGQNIAKAHEQNDIFAGGMYHIITTLLPRRAFEYVGGFDTTLPTLEDEDLYRRLQRAGLCAWRVPEALVRYRAEYGESAQIRDALLPEMEAFFNQRDGYLRGKHMCNCSSASAVPLAGDSLHGVQMEGDVLAMPLYTPRRMSSPTQRGRTYERPLMGYPMWVAPSDIAAKPNFWQPVIQEINPDIDTVLKLAGVA